MLNFSKNDLNTLKYGGSSIGNAVQLFSSLQNNSVERAKSFSMLKDYTVKKSSEKPNIKTEEK